MYFIGIDIGTSSVKALAIDESGKLLKTVSKDYPIDYPFPLWAEQNPNDWWTKTKEALHELLEFVDRSKICSIAFSGQMHGLVLLDENDEIIRPAILWNDQRTEKQCLYLNHTIGKNKLLEWTGNIALNGFTAPKLLWVRENEPQNFAKIKKILLPKDYIAYQFSGVFATDYSDASGTLYLDVRQKKWSSPMLELIHITKDQLPYLCESSEGIGRIKPDLAECFGLSKDVTIVIGGGDQAVAAIGGGIVEAGSCSVSLGTSGAVFAPADHFVREENGLLHSFCDCRGKYHVMGVTLSAAASLKWYMEDFIQAEDYNDIIEEVLESDPKENLFFLPYLSGERTPYNDPHAKGAFIGLSIRHHRKDMTRALLEGVCFSIKDCMALVNELNITPSYAIVNGGGSQNDVWCQMLSDILDIPIKKLDINEGPALGAAILASVGSGIYKDVNEACGFIVKTTKEFRPDPKSHQIYSKKYEHYQKLYPILKDFYYNLQP